jgi:hypothetical protein
MLLYEYDDQHNKLVHDYQHVLPNQVEVKFDQVTMLFDDDYDQHNKDDHDYLIEFHNQLVTKINNRKSVYHLFFIY